MRRNVFISVSAVALSCAASVAAAQSTQSQPAAVANPQSAGEPRIPANRGTSERQRGTSSSEAAASSPSAAGSQNARLPAVRKGAADTDRKQQKFGEKLAK